MSDKPKPGAYKWNSELRRIKDEVRLIRHDIDEQRALNSTTVETLHFLLSISGRLDEIVDATNELWEIGLEEKQKRLANDDPGR